MFLIGSILFIIVLIIFYVYSYNKLNASRQNVVEAWSDIDVQLKRRHDLIPNLVNTVNEYARHEKDLFEQIAELRTKALSLDKNDIKGKSTVENELEKTLKSIIALAESYPDLKANTNFLKLQDELTETEDEIASARRIYNSNVADYNFLVYAFPINIVALINHFTPNSFFQND